MNKVTAVIVGLLVVAFGGFATWAIIQNQANLVDYNKHDVNGIIEVSDDSGGIAEHVKGNPDAPVLLVEYADFQCAGCAQAFPRVMKLVEEYGDKLGVIFRNFPLNGHPNAIAAASAVEAAGMQGLYWEMAELVFKNQAVWTYSSADARTEVLAGLVETIGGDKAKLIEDMASKDIKKKIDFDHGLGKKANVGGTPAFYMDGEEIKITGAGTEEEFLNIFRKLIDAKLKSLGLEPGGVKVEEEKDEE